jgi:hypothetical protein
VDSSCLVTASAQCVGNRLGIVPDHTDIRPFRCAFVTHGIREELTTNLDIMPLRSGGCQYGLYRSRRNARFNKHSLDVSFNDQSGEILNIGSTSLCSCADALQPDYFDPLAVTKVAEGIVSSDQQP